MEFNVVSLFPEMLLALEHGITGRAIENGLISLETWNPRDFTHDSYRTVDDAPYGGGPGMVMKLEPLVAAITAAKQKAGKKHKVILLSPAGRCLDQAGVLELGQQESLILIAGRYEGVDERIMDLGVDEQWSIGDYVLSGGELAAMVLIDSITRQIPGALGNSQSAEQDSFVAGLLDYPHYTRPAEFAGVKIPEVLLGGNHKAIARWRLKQALGRTWALRPELIQAKELTQEQQQLLQEFIAEQK